MRSSLRRKSCRACASAKRRCDLSLPRCGRCAERELRCEFPNVRAASADVGVTPEITVPPIHQREPSLSLWTTVSPAIEGSNSDYLGMKLQLCPTKRAVPGSQAIRAMQDFAARADYCARVMTLQPDALVGRGFNAFIHPSQALASSDLRDAFAASALHAARTRSNSALVTAEIARRARQLVQGSSLSTQRNSGLDQVDKLARTQALLVYQCIRLFSADTAQQSQAERDNGVLQTWAGDLRSCLPLFSPSLAPDTEWETWVKHEATRRTLVCVELINGTYAYLRGRWPPGMHCHHNLDFTGQRSLWEAQSATQWLSLKADPCLAALPVNLLQFSQDLRDVTLKDLDDIGTMLHVAAEGFARLHQDTHDELQQI